MIPRSRRLPRLTAAPALLVLAGCGSAEGGGPPEQWRLASGSTIAASLPATSDTSVVLVYDPSDCFSCDGQLARWRRVGEARGWSVRLLLTREPGPDERVQLRLLRVTPDGVIRGPAARLSTPRAYRFAGRTLVDSAVGAPAHHQMLEHAGATGPDAGSSAASSPFSGRGSPPLTQERSR